MEVFSLPHPHRFWVGTTGTGKSTAFMKQWKRSSLPGIYINYNQVDTPFTYADQENEIDEIILAVASGAKIDYYPVRNKKRAKKELAYIIQKFFDCGRFSEKKPFVFAIDEAHILAAEGEKNDSIEEIATSGRSFGFKGNFITQKPSMVSKVLVTQSDIHVIFTLSDYDRPYFRAKGIDFDKVQGMVRSGISTEVSHKYAVYCNGLITGPYQEKI